jgi:hypothetical protein
MPLIKRITKGTPLTFAEGDANLDYLETLANNTSSFATTGSNTFYGSQTLLGGLYVNSQTQTAAQLVGVQNGYIELSLQNQAIAPSASADFVVYGNNGTAFDHYIDMGINGSGLAPDYTYGGAFLGRANDAYLFHVGGNFRIGTATTSSISQSLFLFANPAGNPDLTITGSRIGIQKTGSLNATLDVNGSVIVTGSLTNSGSFTSTGTSVISGSFTVFTGSAVELQVTNTGVKIGNITSDNHNVTGSLLVSGSASVTGSFFATSYVVLSQVSSSLNFANDSAAASGGVPRGGLYRSGSFVLIRLV